MINDNFTEFQAAEYILSDVKPGELPTPRAIVRRVDKLMRVFEKRGVRSGKLSMAQLLSETVGRLTYPDFDEMAYVLQKLIYGMKRYEEHPDRLERYLKRFVKRHALPKIFG